MRVLAAAVSAVLALTTAAQAQDNPNLAAAQAMIDRAQLGDVWAPFADESISTRHAASGLTCHFYPGDTRSDVVIFTGNRPRGEDVGCVRDREGQATTLYATRYDPPITAQHALAEAQTAIRHRFADAQLTPASLTVSSESLPRMHVAHYLIMIEGERWLTSAITAQSGDWIIKLRFTTRARDADELRQAELEANGMMMLALLEIHRQAAAEAAKVR